MNMDAVSNELKNLRRWITWRLEDGHKKPNCRWQDPANWKTFAEVANEPLIGFVFASGDGLVGIDLDDCIDFVSHENGEFSDFAQEVLKRFEDAAYAEISPSGTGIKLWTLGRKPKGSLFVNRHAGLEMYDEGRWFAVTGRVILGMEDLGDGQEGIDWLVEHYLPIPKPKRVDLPMIRIKDSNLLKRARDYINAADKPGPGSRNIAAFSLAGHLFAMVQPDGERLSREDVLGYMREWNASIPVPLDDKELQAVVESSSKNGTARADKEAARPVEDTSEVDLSRLLAIWSTPDQAEADVENDSDEDFCEAMVPPTGILREVYDFYWASSYRRSSVMGLAVALSLCETIFGRRIRSHTDMRTNDYNLILATTGSGKEACETTITKILEAADPTGSHQYPPDIQSGNGLMKAVSLNPCGVWVCDEFGKILQAVLDRKGNQHIKNIGLHLLKLYGKSSGTYGGAAHSDGVRNKVREPHLVILGMSTGSTVFSAISSEHVSDGLFGRIAFWPVQDRPRPAEDMEIVLPSENLIHRVSQWIKFAPGGNLGAEYPHPEVIRMSPNALVRWKHHAMEIDEKMRSESESRAAIWARVAARSMKLALVHRAARIETDPAKTSFEFINIEIEDVNWAIKISNWLARIACGLVRENTIDRSLEAAKAILIEATKDGPVNARVLLRTYRSLSSGDLRAAASELGLVTRQDKSGGRPKVFFEKPMNSLAN
jgi:hypothetical protein